MGCKKLSRCRSGFRDQCHGLFHPLPTLLTKCLLQPGFRPLPVRLRIRHLLFSGTRKVKKPLPPVPSAFDLDPSLFPQQPQGPGQRRAVHGKTCAQEFLIGLPSYRQRGEQAELRDLDACLSQFLVINPRYHPGEAAQILTRAGQVEELARGLFRNRFYCHIRCIYMLYRIVKRDLGPS